MNFPKSLTQAKVLELLGHSLGGNSGAEDAKKKLLEDPLKEVPAFLKIARAEGKDAGEAFLKSLDLDAVFSDDSGVRFLRFLQLLSNDAAVTHHDSRSDFDRPFLEAPSGESPPDLAEALKTERFLQFWEDMRAAFDGLRALDLFGKAIGKNDILILDDNPDDQIRAFAQAIGTHLLGCKEAIRFYNPLIEGGGFEEGGALSQDTKACDRLFQFFTSYQTLGSMAAGAEGVIGGEEPGCLSLIKTFHDQLREWRPKYILVDQLFKLPRRGRNEFLGPAFIRGLIRWLHDDPGFSGKNGSPRPEIIALSRTDDPRRIREAMRAGARGYIVKSRLVSLPAVLARVCLGTQDVGALHRNFRALYDLPNETIGLLHNARLPRIAFHHTKRKPVTDDKGNEADVKDDVKELWSEVLKRVPKTDLHVHAGSVMSREFLVLASLVMLASRWKSGSDKKKEETAKKNELLLVELPNLVKFFHAVIKAGAPRSQTKLTVRSHNDTSYLLGGAELELGKSKDLRGSVWIEEWGEAGKAKLGDLLKKDTLQPEELRAFRASLHRSLGIPDHLKADKAASKLEDKDNLSVALYLLQAANTIKGLGRLPNFDFRSWKSEDLIRVYLLVLGCRYNNGSDAASIKIRQGTVEDDMLAVFHPNGESAGKADKVWEQLHDLFWGAGTDDFNAVSFRRSGWSWPEQPQAKPGSNPSLVVHLPYESLASHNNASPDFSSDPIGYTLASGTRSSNLVEYLLGCEFSGAEHLRHPFLIHVYARMAIMDWVRSGVIYAELKASPDGYINRDIDFDFPGVCRCLIRSLSQAQQEVLGCFHQVASDLAERGEVSAANEDKAKAWPGDFLGERYSRNELIHLLATGQSKSDAEKTKDHSALQPPDDPRDSGIRPMPARLPVKASLIFVGKRHKPLREMIIEAAGAAVLRPPGETPRRSAADFVEHEFPLCRVVGFDLAGPEAGNPPSKHASEFGRLNRLHLPITVHAGENAGAQFIEDSILELGAKRIGHGLSLAEDERLIARVRDDSIAIELCPVCNHQTSQFHEPQEVDHRRYGRPYPLKQFLEAGVLVTINTDNPIISNTDMVREFYQASYAYDRDGLTLWEALRLVRMGFVSAFLNLSDRRQLIEVAEQWIFDHLSQESTHRSLRRLCQKT